MRRYETIDTKSSWSPLNRAVNPRITTKPFEAVRVIPASLKKAARNPIVAGSEMRKTIR